MRKHIVLRELLAFGADDAVALGAPSAKPMTYAGLRELACETGKALAGFGAGRGDRVAIVLPNGPEMAAAFLCVAGHTASAPLNPNYKADEFEFYLSDLGAKLLIVEKGSASPAIDAAKKLGVKIVTLTPEPDRGAGSFTLSGEPGATPAAQGEAGAEDVALVLHTSGTTSRPKIVPLSQRNLCASGWNIAQTLKLTPADRCLSDHAAVPHSRADRDRARLSRGRWQRVLHAGLQRLQFLRLADRGQAHLVQRGADHAPDDPFTRGQERGGDPRQPSPFHPLLVRVPAAPGAERTRKRVRRARHRVLRHDRGVPSDGKQPAAARRAQAWKSRRRGRPELGIMDEAGKLLPAGATGEVVIRGDNVTAGYENNPRANAEAFAHGWFHTGDQGALDEDGYLTITGRLKEIINRGGEKVSPAEVDDVLMDHPAVQQALTFAAPHAKLGEEVAAAVVLREGASVTERAIRDFAASRLADFKVPRKVIFLAEIPKGATGKLQRIGLAQKLGLTGDGA